MRRYQPRPIIGFADSYRAGLLILDDNRRVLFRDKHLEQIVAPAADDALEPLQAALVERLAQVLNEMAQQQRRHQMGVEVNLSRPGSRDRYFVADILLLDEPQRWILQLQDADELDQTNRDIRMATRFRALARHYQTTAHDLKQPLAVISLYLNRLKDLIRANPWTAPQHRQQWLDAVGIMEESTVALSDSLQAILNNLSTTDDADMHFDATSAMERVIHFIAPQARTQEVAMESKLPHKSAFVHGNIDRFRQVLINLCINALEAMPQGGTLRLTADIAGNELVLKVHDSGAGMDEQTANRIFRLHFTTKATGNGLGLVGVHRIVQDMGGQISFETGLGEGSVFEVRLPLQANPGGA